MATYRSHTERAKSRMVAAKGRKRLRFRATAVTPRDKARGFAAWWGGSYNPAQLRRSRWRPVKKRRKLGARRKTTLIESVFHWIKVPTGKVRRRRG